jgi:hypothetical protein
MRGYEFYCKFLVVGMFRIFCPLACYVRCTLRRTNMKSLKCECAGKIMSGLSRSIGRARMYYYYF